MSSAQVDLKSASAFDVPTLAGLFNAGFSGYQFPMQLSEEDFSDHVALYDIDLTVSTVVVDDGPVAFALVGRRGNSGWIGGMGTTPEYRRRGLGEKALVAGIDAAVARGCAEIGLEVLAANEPAFRLYTKLGFDVVRELAVWSLPPTATQPADAVVSVEVDRAQEWIAAHRRSPEPWQRADDTVAALQHRGVSLRGLVVERAGEPVAAAIVRQQPEAAAVLQIAAAGEDVAAGILLAAAGGSRTLRLSNVPVDEPASHAMERLGANHVATQHEMALRAPSDSAPSHLIGR